MRRILLALVLLLAAAPCAAQVGVWTLLNAVTSTGASSAIDTGGGAVVSIQVYSAAGSSCTVLIEQSTNNTVWSTAATLTDPSAAGSYVTLPSAPYTRANVSARPSWAHQHVTTGFDLGGTRYEVAGQTYAAAGGGVHLGWMF
jgi:hypothetical protein